MYNPYSLNVERLRNQKQEIDNLLNNYQNMAQQQPMNVFNVGNTPQIEFEARIIGEKDKPDEILIQRKTMFFEPKNGKLYIKELNGELKSYDVILPKTEEQLRIEELEKQNKELLEKLKERKVK